MPTVGPEMLEHLKSLVVPRTIIDCGHYSYTAGPTELDNYLWELGTWLYSVSGKSKNAGLMLLVDDMSGVASNAQRREFDINTLPLEYKVRLRDLDLQTSDVTILSQDELRTSGKKAMKEAKHNIPSCELISAESNRWRQSQGYDNAILLYDESKTDGGINLLAGIERAKEVFGTKIDTHSFVFSDKFNYKYSGPDTTK